MSRIMVVEDEALVGLELRETLTRLGYEVPPVVNNADKVIEEVLKQTPDLILMDIRLKGFTDGVDAATRIRSFSGIPIIYLTAYSTPDVLGRALKTDPSAYLLKPFDERQLQINIELALNRKKKTESINEKAFVASLLGSLQTPGIMTDQDWTIIACNAAAQEIVGAAASDTLTGQKLTRYLAFDELQKLKPGSFGSLTWKTDTRRLNLHVRLDRIPSMDPANGKLNLVILEKIDPREKKLMENVGKDINQEIFALLPDPVELRPGVEIAGTLLPSQSGSGDIYDIFSPDGRHQVFYLVDVMGHGTLSALFACMIHTMIRSLAEAEALKASRENRPCSISGLLNQVNQQYRRRESQIPFFTIAMGCLDTQTGKLSMVHAGHPSSILVDNHGIQHLKSASNIAMGVFEDMEFQEYNGTIAPGARILLFSDGFLDRYEDPADTSLASALLKVGNIAMEHATADLGICLQALLVNNNTTHISDQEEDASLFIVEYTGALPG